MTFGDGRWTFDFDLWCEIEREKNTKKSGTLNDNADLADKFGVSQFLCQSNMV